MNLVKDERTALKRMAKGIENLTILSAKLQEKYYLGSVNYLDYKKKPAASKNR